MSKPGDYSSQTYSPSGSGPAKSYPTADSKIDSSGKSREKEDLVGLNDKFVRLIEKVKNLEDENKKLDTKLKILKDQEDYESKIDEVVKQLENEMEEQIDNLFRDQEKLKDELCKMQKEKDDTKMSCKDEIQKKGDLENEFVIAKKNVDDGHLEAVDLALELEDLMGKLDFLRVGYDEEIKELESQICNKTVVLRDNSQRSLDMDEIIDHVKSQYANMAARTREEAEQWNKKKMDAMVLNVGQREQDVRDLKREIADMLRLIQRLKGDLETLIRKEESLKKEINKSRSDGDENLEKARGNIAELEEALKRAKQDLAGQIREHQELMNLKLALDIEIATYHKLLEGEELRMSDLMRNGDVHQPEEEPDPEPSIIPETITNIPETPVSYPAVYPASKKRLLIKVEVQEGKVVSEISQYTEE
ncbi:Keratin, type II cytoskeletal 8 [Collichthys lucidus]|uniref:Keratin, type II cytoskeletal 8 n=1 Tax=Collichthys lucidus TaxID=240159 RepID=A0A4U5TYI8_COLLU|nr:Keratin, type II cytoskeletal 8 [Collichthys lucidus]